MEERRKGVGACMHALTVKSQLIEGSGLEKSNRRCKGENSALDSKSNGLGARKPRTPQCPRPAKDDPGACEWWFSSR